MTVEEIRFFGSGRSKGNPRCSRCAMHLGDCLCSAVQARSSRTRVVVICHAKEIKKTTNTSRWLALCLANFELHYRGLQDTPIELELDPERSAILYPSGEARELKPDDPLDTLVVPDGTWKQVPRALRREPCLRGLRHVCLAPGPPSSYRLRHQRSDDHVSTFEAVARALGVLEGDALQAALEANFQRFVETTLRRRGQLPRLPTDELVQRPPASRKGK